MRTGWLGVAAVVMGAGCSAVEPADYPEAPDWQREDLRQESAMSTLSLRTDAGTAVVLSVGSGEVIGPDLNLGRFEDPQGVAIRGRAFGQPVNLDATEDRVTGLVGGGPIDLQVTRSGDALAIRGIVLGRPSRLRIDDRVVQGTVGRCAYDLERGESFAFEGRRSCGGPTEHVRLWVPTELGFWGDAQRAAVLSILLAR